MSKKDGPTKAEKKALREREEAIVAKLNDRATKAAKKSKAAKTEPDVKALDKPSLKTLVEDRTLPKSWRAAAKAELAARKAKKLAKSKTGDEVAKPKKAKAEPVTEESAPAEAGVPGTGWASKVLADPDADPGDRRRAQDIVDRLEAEREAAKTALAAEGTEEPTDEEIRARVTAKRTRRQELEALAADIDRDDEEAVKAYNAEVVKLGGGTLLTSTAEKKAQAAKLRGDEPAPEKPAKSKKVKAEAADVTVAGLEPGVVQNVKVRYKRDMETGESLPAHVEVNGHVAEPVETEEGTVYAVGTAPAASDDETFAKPSEAPKLDFDVNGNGQYQVQPPDAKPGVLRGYTRVTTYIDALEDKSLLERWKMRTLLEGVTVHDIGGDEREAGRRESAVVKMSGLIHARDVAIAKAHKADRKGKLEPGDLARLVSGALSDFRKAADALAAELLEVGGAHEKADIGTNLHAVFEQYDNSGESVEAFIESGRVDLTASDIADLRAYAAAVEAAGLKFIPECTERPVVLDDLKVAGRMDRAAYWRAPGTQRAKRVVVDVKTGRIDYGAGKIAQQLGMYARGLGYDLDTHERVDLKLDKTVALVIHVPAGTGTAHIYPVDLKLGAQGIALSGNVRAWRNNGKKGIDFKTDLAAPAAPTEAATA